MKAGSFWITRTCLKVILNVTHPHVSVRIQWVPLKILEKKPQDREGPAQQGFFLCHQPGIVVVENSTKEQTLIGCEIRGDTVILIP